MWWLENPYITDDIDPTDLCVLCGVSRDRHPTVLCSGEAGWMVCGLPPGFFWDNEPSTIVLEGFEKYRDDPYRDPNARRDADGDYQWWLESVPDGYADLTVQDLMPHWIDVPNMDAEDKWPSRQS